MANKIDQIEVEILEDGTVSLSTGDLSGPNHFSADELLEALTDLLGGSVTIKNRNKLAMNVNMQSTLHSHTHDGHTHTH